MGNYALFEGALQRIETVAGLESSSYLDPMPISQRHFEELGYRVYRQSTHFTIYLFETLPQDGIAVVFIGEDEFTVREFSSQIEYPFVRWVHELQNLVEDRIARQGAGKSYNAATRQISIR